MHLRYRQEWESLRAGVADFGEWHVGVPEREFFMLRTSFLPKVYDVCAALGDTFRCNASPYNIVLSILAHT
jgi:hypothetical protein